MATLKEKRYVCYCDKFVKSDNQGAYSSGYWIHEDDLKACPHQTGQQKPAQVEVTLEGEWSREEEDAGMPLSAPRTERERFTGFKEKGKGKESNKEKGADRDEGNDQEERTGSSLIEPLNVLDLAQAMHKAETMGLEEIAEALVASTIQHHNDPNDGSCDICTSIAIAYNNKKKELESGA